MKFDVRIDPLTIEGTFDTDFYGSEEYFDKKKLVEKYVNLEGFSDFPDSYFLFISNQHWHVIVSEKKV